MSGARDPGGTAASGDDFDESPTHQFPLPRLDMPPATIREELESPEVVEQAEREYRDEHGAESARGGRRRARRNVAEPAEPTDDGDPADAATAIGTLDAGLAGDAGADAARADAGHGDGDAADNDAGRGDAGLDATVEVEHARVPAARQQAAVDSAATAVLTPVTATEATAAIAATTASAPAGGVPSIDDDATPAPEYRRMPWSLPGPWSLALAVFVIYGTISVARYLRLGTMSWDLGLFTEAVKQYAHLHLPVVDIRAPGFDLLGEHFHPIIALLAPFFLVFPSPVTLLLGQAVLVAVSVVPITRLAMRRLGPGFGYAVGFAYGFSWGLQNAIDFDFHEIAFAVPLLALSLVALVDGRTRACILWAIPLVFVKEDQGLAIAGIGAALALRGERRAGIGLALFGIAATALTVAFVIPHFNPQHTYPFWNQAGGADPTAHTGLSSQASAAMHQLSTQWPTKLHTLWLLVLPTALLALFSPISLAIVLPILLRYVSNNPYYWGTTFHYNAPLMPILFVAALDTLIRWREAHELGRATPLMRAGAKYGAVAMLAACVALADEFPVNSFWSPKTTFDFGGKASAAFKAVSVVPKNVSVATTLDLLAPLAARDRTYWLGTVNNTATEYVVFDNDNSGWDQQIDPLNFVEHLLGGAQYQQIYADQYGIYVFRRIDH